jgi:hypothetical protein
MLSVEGAAQGVEVGQEDWVATNDAVAPEAKVMLMAMAGGAGVGHASADALSGN